MTGVFAWPRIGLLTGVLCAAVFAPLGPPPASGSPAPRAPAAPLPSAHAGHGAGPSRAALQGDVAPLLGNLGAHHVPITTRVPLAQRYFDEGMTLTYGFNHAEAIRSFLDAITLDPACAMCWWGVALAHGPNINAPMPDSAVAPAWGALQQARQLMAGASERERAYIEALSARYVAEPVADRTPLDRAYADAMRELSQRYPDDLEAATLFAEALMDLSPWDYWTKDGQPTEYTDEIVATLESVIARNPDHPGATHFYIHAVEASETPGRAIPAAERLETLAPGAGHLVHMPAHTYWRVGRYQDAVRVNEAAIASDEQYFQVGGVADLATHGGYVFGYYPHNIHFVFAGAQMSGQSALALAAARKLVDKVPDDAIRASPGLEDFRPMPLYALVRFGRWAEVLAEPQPPADMPFATAIWHWARGLAFLRQGQPAKSEAELTAMQGVMRAATADETTLMSRSNALVIADLAASILAGEIAGARGRPAEQLAALRRAVAIQDDLPYIEPPAWFYPVRHTLGAALLKLGEAAEAEAVYRADLREYPDNGWSLYGLAASLRAQGRAAEAAEVQRRFEAAWQHADFPIVSSGF